MKNKTFAVLQSSLPRFMLLGILLLTFTIGDPLIARAQGETTQNLVHGVAATAAQPTNSFDDDCGDDDDDRVVRNTGSSDSEDCPPPVRVVAVWTADETLNAKTSFGFGESIRWVITLKNTTKHTTSVILTYVVKDPAGKVIRRSELSVSAKPGESIWPKSGMVPSTEGTYSFTGSVKYQNSTTRKTVKYDVGSACHTLTTSSNPAAGGAVVASPPPDCNSGTQYANGTVVTLTANANSGYAFSNWSDAATGSTNPTTITMTEDQSATANFVAFTGLTAGIHDDTNPAWGYTGNWTTTTNAGYYNSTSHTSMVAGNDATVAIDGSRFNLFYTGDTDHGSMDVYVDDVKIDTIDQSSTTTVYQSTWTSPELVSGAHTLKFVHVSGTVVDIDAIQVCGAAVAVEGIYDDNDCIWTYSGSWSTWSGTGPYANTMHYTNETGASASFTFQAPARFILFYQGYPNRSNILISVDGGTPVAVNAFSPVNVWQQSYTSEMYLDNGTHTVTISTPGDGKYIDVDAIQIVGPPAALGPGTYDDIHPGLTYTGSWLTWSGTGPYNNTMHYTNETGASASFTFQAPARFILLYQGYPNRSNILISVDGGTPVAVNAFNATNQWQNSYTSAMYSDTGTHTVTISTPGDGKYIDVDAITIE